MTKCFKCFVFFILFGAFCFGLSAADYADGLLDLEKIIETAAEIVPEEYPNADDILVDDHILARYRPDGTSESWDDTVIKVLTEKGKREHSSLSFYFTIPYAEIKVLKLEIIRPDGNVIPIDVEAQSREMVNPSQMGSNIYNPNSKILKVNIPGLEIGDMLRYVLYRNEVKVRVPGTWSDIWLGEYTSPIKRLLIEVEAPAELPLTHRFIRDEIPGTVEYSSRELDSGTVHRWELRDIPQMYREPDMPSLHTVVQRILVSTIPDWQTVSRWYWNLSKPRLEAGSPELQQKVAELIEGLADDQSRIEKIFYYVAQNIRYMGITIEEEAPGYEPHDVSLTFKNKYGVCRDKAALLVAMLREAGLEAFPVLIMSGPKKDVEIPNPYFNHAVVAVRDADGVYQLMDPTDENTRSLLPEYLCDCSYLVATPEGEDLQVSPIIPAEENMMELSTEMELNAAGTLLAETKLDFNGINDGAYRGWMARLKPDERRRAFERIVKRSVAGAELLDFELLPEDVRNTSVPLQIRLKYVARDLPVRGEGVKLLPLPWVGTSVGMVNFILGNAGLEERKYPMETGIACGVTESFRLKLSSDFGLPLSLPEYPEIENEALSWHQGLRYEEGVLKGENTFMMKDVRFSPEQYLELKQILRDMEFSARKRPVFSEGKALLPGRNFGPDVDLAILSHELVCEVRDRSSWVRTDRIRKQVFSYAGKKNNSELKFHFNPAWEDVELISAKVTAADGTVKEINEDEINLMDAGWVGSAPRYPAARIMVASLPGVEVGSIIEYTVRREYRHQPFFAVREYLQGKDPVVSKKLIIRNPEGLLLKIRGDDGKIFESTDRELGWTVTDVPPLRSESSLPPGWTFIPHVAASAGDWQLYAKQVKTLLDDAAARQPGALKKATEIARSEQTPRDKVLAIRDYVARNVRRAGPGFNSLPFSAISQADRVLADGYGNSTDQAVLLLAMLRAVGMQPELLLVGGHPDFSPITDGLEEMPLHNTWNSVLLMLEIDGEPLFLNDGNQYADIGTTAHADEWALNLGSVSFVRIQPATGKGNRTDRTWRISLDKDGTALISRTETIRGSQFGAMKKLYAEMPPEERRRHFQELVASVSQSAMAEGDLKTEFDKYPGIREFRVRAPRYAVNDGNRIYFSLPEGPGGLSGLDSDHRENPLYWSGWRRGSRKFYLQFPGDNEWRLRLAPESKMYEMPGGAGTVIIGDDREKTDMLPVKSLFIGYDIELNPAIFPAADYELLKMFHRRLTHSENMSIMIEPVPVAVGD